MSATVAELVDVSARLPDLPFRAGNGHIAVGGFSTMLGEFYVPVLRALTDAYGDTRITVVMTDPDTSTRDTRTGFRSRRWIPHTTRFTMSPTWR
jgi:hypothetical protein